MAWLSVGGAAERQTALIFPHAGAGAAYYVRLARALAEHGAGVAIVRYPGRETRLGEPLADSIAALVERLADDLTPLATGSFSFFGHSLGALVAFEMAHAWRRAGRRLPKRMWLSGRRAPQMPADLPHLHALPDDDFLAAVNRRYDALPAALLAEPDLVALTVPILRADFRCVETYAMPERSPLDMPFTILRGAGDRWLDDRAVEGWSVQTTAAVDERVFAGGHFYLDAVVPELARLIVADSGSRSADRLRPIA